MDTPVTWRRAWLVWNAITWRLAAAFLVTIVAVLVPLGFLMVKIGVPASAIDPMLNITCIVIMVVASVWSVKATIGRTYEGARLSLITPDAEVTTRK